MAKRTIDTHRQNLLHKLNAKNTAGLVKAAFRLQLI
ncbi:MAG: response regulator transcription factor [Chitinophagaceae bacterium]|nr:response regulator transcription factor [Chitinophagaceae bacterium]